METLGEEKSKTSMVVNPSSKKPKISELPIDVIDGILSRLPVKSILQCKSVSKPWLSRISDPLFTKLYFTRSTADHRTALFISAYDSSTHKRHFLSAAHDGGPVTHLMTLDNPNYIHFSDPVHLNGLVFFTCTNWAYGKYNQYVLNPTTRKTFELPHSASLTDRGHGPHCYLFGFDESRNEHKILMVRRLLFPPKVDVMIFSITNYSWRKIDSECPVAFKWCTLYRDVYGSVCVNSVVYVMPRGSSDILAFDFRTEKFSMIGTPPGFVPREPTTRYSWDGKLLYNGNKAVLIKINGCIGVVCHDNVVQSNKMHIWILQDYENSVWFREVITLPEPWIELDHPYPLNVANMDEIIFSSSEVSGNVISLPIYNKKSKRCKVLRFTLGDEFLSPKTVEFKQIKCYAESIMPL
ncbi:putative F-box domain-containing protein [Helianthus debilis subsp. tardiflorus]